MSSDVDICNLALSHLGDRAEVTAIVPPDGTMQSAQCGRFYPVVRALLLEMFPWTFATKRVALAEAAVNPAPDDWTYAYAVPSTCIRPLSALYPGVPERPLGNDTDAGSYPYLIEAASDGALVMFTNVPTATLRFIDLITDSNKYTPGFVIAFSRLLASYLAGPILKSDKAMKVSVEQLKIFRVEFAQATAANANVGKRNIYETRVPAHLAGRLGVTTLADGSIFRP